MLSNCVSQDTTSLDIHNATFDGNTEGALHIYTNVVNVKITDVYITKTISHIDLQTNFNEGALELICSDDRKVVTLSNVHII